LAAEQCHVDVVGFLPEVGAKEQPRTIDGATPLHLAVESFEQGHGYGSKPWYVVNPKIAGKWMFIPLKMYL
jgi:hypothetical protein